MWYTILVAVLTAYLLGNLNGSVCISMLVAHDDVRKHGSGNAGLTNFIRNYGLGSALYVVLSDAGKAVLLVSLELDEVRDGPDRILVMYEGEIVGEFDPTKVTQEELGLYMAGAKKDEVTA